MKTAFVSGITGQDGGYLAKLLLEKGYKVIGGVRRTSTDSLERLRAHQVIDKVEFVNFDVLEQSNISKVIRDIQPDEFYNLADQSFVGSSFEQTIYTSTATGLSVAYILDAIKSYSPHTKFYQASTSEMFGGSKDVPQGEQTSFYPKSPYGVAKLYAHWMTINYRESYNMFACSGILFNHESPMRGKQFVTRKVTHAIAEIKYGLRKNFALGNLYAKRDWGFAGDYVEGMWRILNHKTADDYVLATGETHSIKEFVDLAFKAADMEIRWEGTGIDEKAFLKKSDQMVLSIDPQFYRPAEVDLLIGNATKAQQILGWKPKVTFSGLIEMMVQADLEDVKRQLR